MDKFQTAISHIAALLNCRTIARVKVENAVQTLTPNHFLIGKLGGAVLTDKPDNPIERWQVHALVDKFWKQFLLDYFPLLSKRSKLQAKQANLEVGEVVLQFDSNAPKGRWKLAVIEEVYPAPDGKVCHCKIPTTTGTYK